MVLAWVSLTALVLFVCERLWTGRRFPEVRGWWPRALFLNGIQVGVTLAAPHLWDGWLLRHRLFAADRLGTVGGALLGYFVITYVYYWWHRWRHEIPFLWRWLHQIHHSAQRVEIITSFYKHPLELLLNGALSSVILYTVCGLAAPSAVIAVLLTGLAELVYHWNVRTPHWLGYLFQRPESHCIHHQEGLHAKNYADLPLWDMLFGTFENPLQWNARCGFGPGKEERLLEMLRGVDVNR